MSYGLSFERTGKTLYKDRILFHSVLAPNFNVEGDALADPDHYHNVYPTIHNPILSGKNIYAPDILTANNRIYCYYGGWLNSSDENDRIYLSYSDDLEPVGPWPYRQVIIDNGEYKHVNDPSVVEINASLFYMVYTVGFFEDENNDGVDDEDEYRERIDWAYSTNRLYWTPSSAGASGYRVNLTDPNNVAENAVTGADITNYGRPSLLKQSGNWVMYFDAKLDKGDPKAHWTFRAVDSDGDDDPDDFVVTHYLGKHQNGGWPYLLEADVYKHSNGKYYAVYRSNNWEIWQAESDDGISWENEVVRIKTNSPHWPYYHPSYPNTTSGGFSNPSWFFSFNNGNDPPGMIGIAYGITDTELVNDHDIGFAYNQYIVQVRSPVDDGDDVWHVYGNSEKHPIFHLYTNGYASFDQVRVINPVNGHVLFTQNFSSAKVGDIWTLVE